MRTRTRSTPDEQATVEPEGGHRMLITVGDVAKVAIAVAVWVALFHGWG